MGSARLTLLDVGHGNAAVYVGQDGDALVIDGGADHTLSDLVAADRLTRLVAIYVSHADKDHLRGVLLMLENHPGLRVDAVYVNPAQEKRTALWASFSVELDRLESAGTTIITALTRSFPGTVAYGDVEVEVLSPPPARVLVENDDNRWSAMIRLHVLGEPAALLCADIDDAALSEVLDSGRDIRADLLVFPHHGGRPGRADPRRFAERLTAAAGPSLVVFSMGRERFDNPLPAVLQGVRDAGGARVACTQLSKRCSLVSHPGRQVAAPSAGAPSGNSCAGTITLALPLVRSAPQQALALLELDGHATFVAALALGEHSPQCMASG